MKSYMDTYFNIWLISHNYINNIFKQFLANYSMTWLKHTIALSESDGLRMSAAVTSVLPTSKPVVSKPNALTRANDVLRDCQL